MGPATSSEWLQPAQQSVAYIAFKTKRDPLSSVTPS